MDNIRKNRLENNLLKGKWKENWKYIVLFIIPILLFFISFTVGQYSISIKDLVKTFYYHFTDPSRIIDANMETVLFNVRLPKVIAVLLVGGGSIVKNENGKITVGPESVGYEITKKALVFGGDTITATDIAVKFGLVDLGDRSKTDSIDEDLAKKAFEVMKEMVEDSLDNMKLSNEDVNVILVGGGSVILPEKLEGASSVNKPNYFSAANAIGAGISKVSGVYDKLVDYDKISREEALELAKKEAIENSVKAGAIRETVVIVDIEETTLAYHSGNTVRIKIKAAGDFK